MNIFDKRIHDAQHMLSSLAGAILGLGIFVTYYFFSRMESQNEKNNESSYPWEMKWYYYVVGIFLCMSTGMALGCMLSTATRPRITCK